MDQFRAHRGPLLGGRFKPITNGMYPPPNEYAYEIPKESGA